MKKYIVRLTCEEQETLKKLLASGRGSGRMFTRVRILLKADQSDKGPGWSDERISEAFDVTVQTIERVRKQLVEEGFEAVLSRHQYIQKVSRKKIDGDVDSFIEAGAKNIAYETQLKALVEFGIIELLEILHKNVDEKTYLSEANKVKTLLNPTGMGDRFKMASFRKE